MAVRSPAAPRPATVTWDSLQGKPAAFAPASHTHSVSDISGLQTALDGKQAAGSYVPSSGFTWANLTGKPSTFAPAAHTHSYNDLTDKPTIPTTGRWTLIGNVTINKTVLVLLAAGTQREVLTLSGVTTADQGKLAFAPITACAAGCEAINIYATGTNQVTVAYSTPLLAVGAIINIPLAVYRIS